MHKPLFSERKPSINQVKITLELTEKQTELNQGKPKISKTLKTETSTEFSRVKSRLDKLNQEIKQC